MGKRKPRCANSDCNRATNGEGQPLCWKCYSETPVQLRAAHSGACRRVNNLTKKLAQARQDVETTLDDIVGYWL